MTTTLAPSALARAAADYAARRWPVLPLHHVTRPGTKAGPDRGRCSCGSRSCTSQGKHPDARLAPRGLKDATTDPELVASWWDRHPTANVGMVTGVAFDAARPRQPPGARRTTRS
jgi:hypothetical protein